MSSRVSTYERMLEAGIREHCAAQGVRVGVTLLSIIDASQGVVTAITFRGVHLEDPWLPKGFVVDPDYLHEWALSYGDAMAHAARTEPDAYAYAEMRKARGY